MSTSKGKGIFDYLDYRKYLSDALPISGPNRGARAKLANALGCKGGFVSLALGGNAHFSLEHAVKISSFLELSDEEKDFFLLLVQMGKAGSGDLELYFRLKIQQIIEKRRLVRERVQAQQELSESDQMTYFSSWYFGAIHMCLFASHLRTRAQIAHVLKLSQKTVADVLDFLVRVGMAASLGEKYEALPSRMHLSADSPLISKHHCNWRIKCIQSLDESQRADLHYSLVMSLSEKAAEEIRELFLSLIQDAEPILKAAKDETVYCMNLDLFTLLRPTK